MGACQSVHKREFYYLIGVACACRMAAGARSLALEGLWNPRRGAGSASF